MNQLAQQAHLREVFEDLTRRRIDVSGRRHS
jgi:hypothetical protein